MEIGDLVGVGKSIEKFMDVVAKGVGRVYNDTLGIKAESNRIKQLGIASAQADLAKREILAPVEERIKDRIAHTEARRQNNIESVLSLAYKGLSGSVNEEEVNSDWIARYFDYVKDISDEEMRIVWAKILTGEIEQPGKFSARTLDTIRNIAPKEAKLFQTACSMVMGDKFIIKPDSEPDFQKYGLNHYNLLELTDAGLLIGEDILTAQPGPRSPYPINFKNCSLLLSHPSGISPKIKFLSLSKVGFELFTIINVVENESYLKDLKVHFENQGFKVDLEKNARNTI